MSNKRRSRRLVTKNNSNEKPKTFFEKHVSIISISIGAIIGLIIWFISFRCTSPHCINHYYPIPYMGISAIICWVIGLTLFKK